MAGIQAGAPVGRLSIELVAEVARLQQDLDRAKKMVNAASGDIARSAKSANDNLKGIGMGAGNNVVQFSREVARLKGQLDPAWAATQRYREQVALLRQALAEGALTHKQFVQELGVAVAAYRTGGDAITKSTGAQRAGMQQLSMQLGDMATMWSLGARPMQIFASQGSQVVQAISLMQGGASKFTNFMLGPWGTAITVATLILVPLVGSLFDTGDAAKKAEDSIKNLSQQFDFAKLSAEELRKVNMLLADANAEVERTAIGAANATRISAEANRQNALSQLQVAEAELARRNAIFDASASAGSIPAMGKGGLDLDNQLAQIKALRALIMGFGQEANKASFNVQILTAGLNENGRAAEKLRTQINDLRVQYQTTGNSNFLNEALRLQSQLNDLNDKSSASHRRKKDALSDEEKAYKKAFDSTQQFIDSLTLEIAKIGLSEQQQRALEIQRAKEAAATAEQRQKIDELNISREKALKIEEDLAAIKEAKSGTASLFEEIAALQREAQALGLVGWERERLLDILETEAKIRPLLVQIADAELKGNIALAQELQKQVDLLKERLRLQLNAGDAEEAIQRQAEDAKLLEEAARRANAQLADMARLLNDIGGFGSVLGSLLAISTGNYNSIAQGPLGDLLATVLNMQTGWTKDENGKVVARLLGDELRDVFGPNGVFGTTLVNALQGAGIGVAAGGIVAGNTYSSAEKLGATIGGVAGNAIGTAIAGPIGGAIGSAILGSIGSLIGGLVSGPAKGSVTISNGQVVAGRGSDQQMLANANSAAASIVDSLTQLADALGGTLDMGAGTVSIGQRKGNWVVDIFGRGNTTGAGVINFGADSEAAIMFAMQNLIEDGVLTGIRASTMNLLKAGTDFQAQLEKAVAFETVLKAAEAAASPFVAQLSALQVQFTQLTAIFAEANATAEEYAALQAYITQQQQALVDQASSTYRSTFYTDAQNAAYAQQQISATLTPMGYGNVDTVAEYTKLVEATDPLKDPALYGALMDLADEFGVLKEAADNAAQAAAAEAAQKEAAAAEAAAKAKQIADQRAQLEIDLLNAQGRELEAVAKARQMELAALDPSLRALQEQVWRARDIADAQNVLRDAYNRQSTELQQTIDKFQSLGDSLRDVRAQIYSTTTGTNDYARQLALLKQVGTAAGLGDETAMNKLGGVIQDFLPAAKSQARTLAEYQMAQAMAARYADSAISAADQGLLVAQQNLEELKTSVGKLIDIEQATISVEQAIQDLTALMGGSPAEGGGSSTPPQQSEIRDGLDRLRDRLDTILSDFNSRWERMEAAQVQSTLGINSITKFFKDAGKGGNRLRVSIAEDETA